jgi:hypothetical protein
MGQYKKSRKLNIKGRARDWVNNSRTVNFFFRYMDSGVKAAFRDILVRAVYKLMREAYEAGCEEAHQKEVYRMRR